MGQRLSLLPASQVIDIKRQSAATDLLDSAVWFYDAVSGRNLWGNKAALQLFSLSQAAFCAAQQPAWQAAAGQAACQAWQQSNKQLVQGLDGQGLADGAQQQLCADEFSIHLTSAAAGAADSAYSGLAVHAGFLPLPAGVLSISARLKCCAALHKKKRVAAYLVQVVSVQPAPVLASNSITLQPSGNEVAKLQLQLSQQLSNQARELSLTMQQSNDAAATAAAAAAGAAASENAGLGDAAAQVLVVQPRAGSLTDTQSSTAGPRSLFSQQSSSLHASQARSSSAAAAAGTAAAAASEASDGFRVRRQVSHSLDHGVQAAAASLRQSFDRQASAGFAQRPALSYSTSGGHSRCHNSTLFALRQQSESINARGGATSAAPARDSGDPGTSQGPSQQHLQLRGGSYLRSNSLLQLQPMSAEETAARQARLTEMCENHPMFQFLFDVQGVLLAANRRAMINMREHLGEQSSYTLPQYLAIGQCDGGLSAEQIFTVMTNAIFVNQEPCFRMPQLRWSKRRPGKCRWVLYEVWGMTDPITGQPALLVTEQNITQVKSVEEQYSSQMRQLEVQLEEALAQQQAAEAAAAAAAAEGTAAVAGNGLYPYPAIDTSSAADKTLQLLDKILTGSPVSLDDAESLRTALLASASNLHAPLFLDEQVLHHTAALAYDSEVGASLLQMLSTRHWEGGGTASLLDMSQTLQGIDDSDAAHTSASSSSNSSSYLVRLQEQQQLLSLSPAAGDGGNRASSRLNSDGSGPAAAASSQQQQQQQPLPVRGSLPSAYPSVTVDLCPAAAAVATATATAGSTHTVSAGAVAAAGSNNNGLLPAMIGGAGAAQRASMVAAARDVINMASAPTLEVESLLARVDDWQFDSFALAAATNNRPLSVLGFFIMKRSGLVQRLCLDEGRLARWLLQLEAGYPPNPYHNRVHAADVLRNAHVLMNRGGVGVALCGGGAQGDDIALLALYLAAVVHDFGHQGVNNDFLVRSSDALALLYNDRSPHENHHLAASWGVLVEHNFLRGMAAKNKELLRRLIIEMVLATDMKQHFAIHGLFQSKVHIMAAATLPTQRSTTSGTISNGQSGSLPSLISLPSNAAAAVGSFIALNHSSRRETFSLSASPSKQHMMVAAAETAAGSAAAGGGSSIPAAWGGASSGAAGLHCSSVTGGEVGAAAAPPVSSSGAGSFVLNRLRSSSSMLRRGGSMTAGAGSGCGDGSSALGSWEEDTETRSLYLQMTLKASDLGHLAAPRDVHRRWVDALEEEHFRQGDRERAAGLAISPLMDRTKQGITKSQVGFFDIVVLPLFRSMAQRFPGSSAMLDAVLDNYTMWKEQEVAPHS